MDSTVKKYKPLKAKKTSDLAVEAIWDLISSGELKPGEKLPPERELAERFEISMTSLREALQKLESYGHISKKRGKSGGSIILDISENPGLEIAAQNLKLAGYSIDHINQAVFLILQAIYEEAMKIITPEQIEKLDKLSRKQKEEFEQHKGSALGWRFSAEIVDVLDNPILRNIEELLMLLLMQKEFSLGIDDLGRNERAEEYNRNATEFTADVVTAFRNQNKNLLAESLIKMNRQLKKFSEFDK